MIDVTDFGQYIKCLCHAFFFIAYLFSCSYMIFIVQFQIHIYLYSVIQFI